VLEARMSALVLGIDPGLGGALALLTSDGVLLDLADMPVLADGAAGRRAINAPLLAARVRAWGAGVAYCELVGPRPGEGAVGAFGFGRSRGIIEGTLGALAIPVEMVAPAWWKRRVGIPPGKVGTKDAARSEAIRRWPARADLFARVKDDGRTEAALIAVAGMTREGR